MSENAFKDDKTDAVILAHEVDLSTPDVELLPRYPFQACDGHELPTIQAIIGYSGVVLCGHCAHSLGVASHQALNTWLREEKKTQGSEN